MAPPAPSRKHLADAIKRLRLERNLTIVALAKSAGIHVSYLSRIERYSSSPTWDKINAIIGALGITPQDLIDALEVEASRPSRRP